MIHRSLALAVFLLVSNGARSDDACLRETQVAPAQVARTVIVPGKEVRRLEPTFFGFNLEWLEFQSGLWDSATGRVRPDAVAQLQAFPGAIYRYPGGHHANHLDWHDAVGPVDKRPLRSQVSWAPPTKVLFGPREYLQFVQQVHGEPWYVANLQGRLHEPLPPAAMAKEAGDLARYLRSLAEAGLPAVTRWELGNELDRSDYRWPPARLTEAARQVAAAISTASPKATFVHLQEEYPAMADQGFTAERYNQTLRKDLAALNPAYAMHAYYDGPPAGPPVSYFLRQVCKVVDAAKAEGRAKPEIWLTEHARVPPGAFVQPDWRRLSPGTADLQAALSVADMTLALASIPEVQGAFVHALHASTGPWPMWRRSSGQLTPTPPFQALSLIRQVMLPVVLFTKQSAAPDDEMKDTPAVRTLVLRSVDSSRFTVLAVNRSRTAQRLVVEGLPASLSSVTRLVFENNGVQPADHSDGLRSLALADRNGGTAGLDLPAASLTAFTFARP